MAKTITAKEVARRARGMSVVDREAFFTAVLRGTSILQPALDQRRENFSGYGGPYGPGEIRRGSGEQQSVAGFETPEWEACPNGPSTGVADFIKKCRNSVDGEAAIQVIIQEEIDRKPFTGTAFGQP
jgi:hypothetical protein